MCKTRNQLYKSTQTTLVSTPSELLSKQLISVLGRAPLRCGSEVTPAERSLALLPVVWSPLSA